MRWSFQIGLGRLASAGAPARDRGSEAGAGASGGASSSPRGLGRARGRGCSGAESWIRGGCGCSGRRRFERSPWARPARGLGCSCADRGSEAVRVLRTALRAVPRGRSRNRDTLELPDGARPARELGCSCADRGSRIRGGAGAPCGGASSGPTWTWSPCVAVELPEWARPARELGCSCADRGSEAGAGAPGGGPTWMKPESMEPDSRRAGAYRSGSAGSRARVLLRGIADPRRVRVLRAAVFRAIPRGRGARVSRAGASRVGSAGSRARVLLRGIAKPVAGAGELGGGGASSGPTWTRSPCVARWSFQSGLGPCAGSVLLRGIAKPLRVRVSWAAAVLRAGPRGRGDCVSRAGEFRLTTSLGEERRSPPRERVGGRAGGTHVRHGRRGAPPRWAGHAGRPLWAGTFGDEILQSCGCGAGSR